MLTVNEEAIREIIRSTPTRRGCVTWSGAGSHLSRVARQVARADNARCL